MIGTSPPHGYQRLNACAHLCPTLLQSFLKPCWFSPLFSPLLPRHRPQPPIVIQSSTVSNQKMSVRPTSASHHTTNKLDHGTCTHSHFHTHTPSTLMLPHQSQSTMTICPPTTHDPRQQLPTLHNATPFGYSGHSWPSMDGFSSSTPAQQGRPQIHSTLAKTTPRIRGPVC